MVLVGRRQLRSNNSWMHNLEPLVKGKERCTAQLHPDDAERLGLADGAGAVLSSAAGAVEAPVEITDAVMPGVVSLPHGWGHDQPGMRMAVAAEHAGVNSNVLADETAVEPVSGNAVLNGIPVDVIRGRVASATWRSSASRTGSGRRRRPRRREGRQAPGRLLRRPGRTSPVAAAIKTGVLGRKV